MSNPRRQRGREVAPSVRATPSSLRRMDHMMHASMDTHLQSRHLPTPEAGTARRHAVAGRAIHAAARAPGAPRGVATQSAHRRPKPGIRRAVAG